MSLLENKFKLRENGTNVRTEFIAGLTTFFTMAYIIFVNPNILGWPAHLTIHFQGADLCAHHSCGCCATLIMFLV